MEHGFERRQRSGREPDRDQPDDRELYAAELEGLSPSQTRLCVAAGVPQTTAHHVTRRLAEAGIFTRQSDTDDRRLIRIALSADTAERMRAYLAATYEVAGPAA